MNDPNQTKLSPVKESFEDRFIQHLEKLDRKAYAELRRSLAFKPTTNFKVIPYVEPYAAAQTNYRRTILYLFSGLYCLVNRPLEGQEKTNRFDKNLGASIGKLYLDKDKSGSIEKRFTRLLDADNEQLSDRLRQMITLLNSNSIPISWTRLLTDLFYWNAENRSVQQNWARAFYQQESLQAESERMEKQQQQTNEQEGEKQ